VDPNLEIGLVLVEELALVALPAIAAAMFAAALGMRSPVLLIGVALASSGAAAMLIFWAFYADPLVGKTLSDLLVLGSAAAIVALWVGGRGRDQLRELAVPLGLWVLASFFVVYLGFLHGTGTNALQVSSARFSHNLPTDNLIPLWFAEWFYVHGHHGTPPPFGDWLASDRPPLQIGYVLALRPFGTDFHALPYELLGVVLQQLWVPAIWALLRASGLSRIGRGLALIAAMVSDIAIVHGFFVWPKLIAAAFVLAAAAMVLSPEWKRWARDPRAAALFAALCACSILGHGSSIFLLIPLLVLAAWRALPSWRWVAVAVASALVLYAPWQAYQKYGDPPGNRLVKWQLGGSEDIDNRGVGETIVDGYRQEGIGGTLGNKRQNVEAIVGVGEVKAALNGSDGDESSGAVARTIEDLRWVRFLGLLPCIGFLLLGPMAMAVRAALDRGGGRGPEWRFALGAGALTLAACVVWALLMFGNPISEAIIHQGSLAVPLLAICVCAAAAYGSYPRFGIGLVAFNALFVLFLYVPALVAPPGTSYSVIAAILAAAALGGFCWTALRAPWTTADSEYTPAP
jgi:hypothetical protein